METSRLVPKKRALLLLHPGFEEIEAVTPADLLRRGGVEVVLASVSASLEVEGGRGIAVRADALLAELLGNVPGAAPGNGLAEVAATFDMLIVPGGPGITALRANAEAAAPLLDLVRAFHARGAWIAAICAAPLLLLDAGLAATLRVTSFPGAAEELRAGAKAYAEERVVLDRNVITARGAGASEEFALALIALLAGAAEAEDIRRRIVARD